MMARRTTAPLLLLLVLIPFAPTATAQEPDPPGRDGLAAAVALEKGFTELAERLAASVVCVSAYRRSPEVSEPEGTSRGWRVASADVPYPGFERINSGSGFFVTAQGRVLCHRRSLLDAEGQLAPVVDVETADRRRTLCRVVGVEPTLELAVLELAVHPPGHPPAFAPVTTGDPAALRAGQWMIALGDPFGPLRTFAVGLLAARPERQCYQGDLTATFLQLSLEVPAGSEGGPVVDLGGRVVGILTRAPGTDGAAPLRGVAFALPIDVVLGVQAALVETGNRVSPWLGFSVLEIAALRKRLRARSAAEARNLRSPLTGVYVDDVHEPGPAFAAGLREGDFLVAVDGQRLLSVVDFQKALHLAGVGREVSLEIFRAGAMLTLRVTIEARPDSVPPR